MYAVLGVRIEAILYAMVTRYNSAVSACLCT